MRQTVNIKQICKQRPSEKWDISRKNGRQDKECGQMLTFEDIRLREVRTSGKPAFGGCVATRRK